MSEEEHSVETVNLKLCKNCGRDVHESLRPIKVNRTWFCDTDCQIAWGVFVLACNTGDWRQ